MDAVCLVSKTPDNIWIHFLNTFKLYDTFIIINDNDYIIDDKFKNLKVKIIKIDNKECYAAGFNNGMKTVIMERFPEITSWEKALYYFTTINLNYKKIWFIEDDCFFMNENILKNIDKKYVVEDLLTKSNFHTNEINPQGWHWESINKLIPPPRCISLIQCCRLSKNLLDKIKNYANSNKRLIFVEAMFNTFAFQHKLKTACPKELSKLECFNYDNIQEINDQFIYHSIKDITKHQEIRNNFIKK